MRHCGKQIGRQIGPLWLWAAAALATGAACSRRDAESERQVVAPTPRPGGRIVVGIQQEPALLNNILQLQKSARLINNAIFSRFVTYDDSLRLLPDLIRDIPTLANAGISPDGLTYTYHLRPDAVWHDGQPLTSADVRFTFEIIMDPDAGAESQHGWDVVDRVDTPDAHTVVFHLKEPYNAFVEDAFYDEDVLPMHLLNGTRGAAFAPAAFHRAPIGSGPFRFTAWVPGSHLIVSRFDDYYGDGPYLDEIVFKIVPEATALGVQLRTGELDGCDNADSSQLSILDAIPGLRLFRTPSLAYTHITFNCHHPLLADVRLRRALALAVDRRALAAHVFEGAAEPALSGRHPRTPWYTPAAESLAVYAPERARALLAACGWRDVDGDGVLERDGRALELEINTGTGRPDRERVQQVLQQQWRSIGVDLGIHNYDMRALIDRLQQQKFEVALFGWQQQPDPSAIADVYGTQGEQNFGRFSSPELDALVARAEASSDTMRVGLYRQVEEVLLHEVPVIPLVWHVELDVMSEKLHNYRPNPSAAGDTWNVHQWWRAP